jgi:hypothetical protein
MSEILPQQLSEALLRKEKETEYMKENITTLITKSEINNTKVYTQLNETIYTHTHLLISGYMPHSYSVQPGSVTLGGNANYDSRHNKAE